MESGGEHMPKKLELGDASPVFKSVEKVVDENQAKIRRLALDRCKEKHPDYYNSLICVGPGSAKGFGPPCGSCREEVRKEKARENKVGKAHGRILSDEEAAEVRKRLGIK